MDFRTHRPQRGFGRSERSLVKIAEDLTRFLAKAQRGSGPILVIYHYGISWHPGGFYLIYLHTMSNYPHAVGTRTRRCPRDRIHGRRSPLSSQHRPLPS